MNAMIARVIPMTPVVLLLPVHAFLAFHCYTAAWGFMYAQVINVYSGSIILTAVGLRHDALFFAPLVPLSVNAVLLFWHEWHWMEWVTLLAGFLLFARLLAVKSVHDRLNASFKEGRLDLDHSSLEPGTEEVCLLHYLITLTCWHACQHFF
jgi:hypothetical protein